jgi:hypothetical protein
MAENTTTEVQVDLNTAELAQQFGVEPQTFTGWKNMASAKTGKTYGTKRGKKWFFTPAEVDEILKFGCPGKDRQAQAPQQTYQAEAFQNEDAEASQTASFLALAQNNQALMADVQSLLVMSAQQEQLVVQAVTTYLHPVNRTARVMEQVAQRLSGAHRHHDTLSNTLAAAFQQAPALPALPDRIDPAFL